MKNKNTAPAPAFPARVRELAYWVSSLLALGSAASGTVLAADWVTVPKNPDPLLQGLNIPVDAPTKGMWSGVNPWPMNGLHTVVLPNGKVLTYGTTADGNTQDGRFMDVWDPALGFAAASHKTTFRAAQVNSFCGAAAFLSTGQLMISGGNSPFDSGLYAPATDTIQTSPFRMADQRWYATMINLPDSRPIILGGMNPGSEGMQNDPGGAITAGLASMSPEVFDPTLGWTTLFDANSRDAFGPDYLRASYPRAWVAPNGQVFGISAETMWYLDAGGNGAIRIAGKYKVPPSPTNPVNVGATNSAVMFAPGKILVAGGNGSFNGEGWPASNMATVVDINGANPVLTEQPRMAFPRRYPNAIVMPNGRVAITGGTTVGNNNGASSVFAAELWNPDTGTWTQGANAAIFRGYHSFSSLLPNGAILSTGGGAPGPVTNLNAELYYPPYLFRTVNGVTQLAPRPVIDAIGGLSFANTGLLELDMTSADPVAKLALIGVSAGTHSFNSGQRYVPLTFTQAGVRLTATVPNANIAPPGYYQVVALDAAGVPSAGVIVAVGQTAPPATPITVTRNTQVALRSVNLPAQAVGIDAAGLGVLQPLSATAPTGADLAATTFISRDGFSNPNCLSFEFAGTPGRFLRHAGFRLQLGNNDGSALFKDDATFCPENGLSGSGVTLRSVNYPANVIRHRTGQIWLDPSDGSAAFNDSASFFLQTPPTAPPPVTTIGSITAPIVASGGTASYNAGSVAPGAQYSWSFGDGSAATGFSTTPTATHQYTAPGLYLVTLTVRLADGTTLTKNFIQAVNPPATANAPKASSSVLLESRVGASARLWTVNPDNNTVSVFDTANNAKVAEIAVGGSPRTLALAPSGRIWVANRDGASLSVISPSTLTVVNTVAMPRASQPFGLVFAPDGSAGYVVLEAGGQLLKLDPISGATLGSLPIGSHARQVSITADSSQILVSRFITPSLPGESTATVDTSTAGGEVLAINAANFAIARTITLRHSDKVDNEIQGSGIPNYLSAPVISPDGSSAWVPSKQDNIKRGTLRGSLGLDFQNTVRAISSRINLASLTEDYASRIDHDNSSVGSAAAYHPSGAYLFVALETSRQVAVVNAIGGRELFKVDVGRAPQGLTVSADGLTLYVQNFMDRSVSVLDLSPLVQNGEFRLPLKATLNAIAAEALPPAVLTGKQFFYDAKDPRLARDSYMSCASCHADAENDGRTWDFTGFGEGLRNTPSLKGRAGMGQGFVHWSANFDEIQDFEGQIRNFAGGTGLMTAAQFATGTRAQPLGDKKAGVSADLDALAAYLNSLNRFDNTPFRATDGTLTSAAIAGKTVFDANGCGTCHTGPGFTNSGDASAMKNVGTLKPTSGKRLNGALTGIDIPTLRDVWATGPYLHDGSAPTLAAAIQAHNTVTLNATDLANVAAYVQQIGAEEVGIGGLPAGALGAWDFDTATGTTAPDTSGNGKTLTLSTGTSITAAGLSGAALQANGANSNDGAATTSSVINTAGSFAVSGWVRFDQLPTCWNQIMASQDGVTVSGFYLGIRPTCGGGTAQFMFSMLAGDADANINYAAAGGPAPSIGTWTHLVGVRDAVANTMSLYVNGALVQTIANPSKWAANGNFAIGRSKFSGGARDPLYGQIDAVRAYGRVLTAAEVTTLFQARASGNGGGVTPVNVPPTVSLTAPGNNASVVQGTAITVSADAADSDGTVARVEFYDGTTLIGSDATAPYSLSWTNAAVGAHSVTARAFDNAGASTTSSAVALSVTASTGTAPPANAVACASEGATCVLPAGSTATVWYGVGTSWFSKTGLTGSVVCTNATFGDPAVGAVKSCVYQVTSSAPVNAAPTVSLTAPANNASVVQGTAITVSANAGDSDGTVARVEFYDGATLIGSDATAPYSLSWTNAAVGAHSVTARAFDNVGASTTSGAVTVNVTAPPANVPPTVSLTAPANNASVAQGTAITVSANAADSDGTVARVEFYDGATLIGSDATAPYSLSWTGAVVGPHSVTAKAFDNAGANTTSGAATVNVTAVTTPAWTKCANQGGVCFFSGTANVRYTNAALGQSAVRSATTLTFCLPIMFGLPFDTTNTGICEYQVP